jgi:hypothetical protein
MSEQLFDVVFFGILQAGKDKEIVMQNMATLFKTDITKLAPYFTGGRKVIKGKINAETAEKYQAALENIGLVINIEHCEKEQSEAETTARPPQQSNQPDAPSTVTAGITLAPAGADVLETSVEVPAQKIADISDITMAEVGADVIANPVAMAKQEIADISSITMAEPGSDVLEHPREVTAQKIEDISEFSIAEVGADIIVNPKPEEKAEIPDTSELSLENDKTEMH